MWRSYQQLIAHKQARSCACCRGNVSDGFQLTVRRRVDNVYKALAANHKEPIVRLIPEQIVGIANGADTFGDSRDIFV